MTTTTTARTVATALAEVTRWRADEDARSKAEKVEVEQEIRNLQTAIQNLQAQLEALHKFGNELDQKKAALVAQELERSHVAVLGVLQAQARGVGLRDQEVGRAVSSRDAALSEKLRTPELSATLEEYRQFKTGVEPTLAALPESYRKVIQQHHEGVAGRLKALVAEVYGSPISVAGDPVECEVVWAVDAPEGNPELLVCIVPVSEQIHSHWSDQDEGVQLWVACRVAQAIYEAAAAVGFGRVHAMAGGHEGVLVIECDIAGAPARIVDELQARLTAVLSGAREVSAVGVRATATKVEMDVLLPPGDEEEGDAG